MVTICQIRTYHYCSQAILLVIEVVASTPLPSLKGMLQTNGIMSNWNLKIVVFIGAHVTQGWLEFKTKVDILELKFGLVFYFIAKPRPS